MSAATNTLHTTPSISTSITIADVMTDLESGRSLPTRPSNRLTALRSRRRPTLGGPTFLGTFLAARVLGRIHPRLARRALLRLWFTPWVHPSTRRPVADMPADFLPWTLPFGDMDLQGYTGGQQIGDASDRQGGPDDLQDEAGGQQDDTGPQQDDAVSADPTVVLVHGWSGRAADWRHLAGDLVAAGWRVVVPDLPAHGMTAGSHTDLFELGAALATVIEHEQPRALVAHSMGFPTTIVALEAGAVEPEVVVALAPGRRLAGAVEAFGGRANLAPGLVAELRRGIEAQLGADVWDVMDVDRVVPTLAARGLVVHDHDDDEVGIGDAREIVAAWPDAAIVTTAGLGHRRIMRDEDVRRRIVAELAPRLAA